MKTAEIGAVADSSRKRHSNKAPEQNAQCYGSKDTRSGTEQHKRITAKHNEEQSDRKLITAMTTNTAHGEVEPGFSAELAKHDKQSAVPARTGSDHDNRKEPQQSTTINNGDRKTHYGRQTLTSTQATSKSLLCPRYKNLSSCTSIRPHTCV